MLLLRWLTLKKFIQYVIASFLVVFVWFAYRLLFKSDILSARPCPPLFLQNDSFCRSIFDDNPTSIDYGKLFTWCRREDVITEDDYLHMTSDCGQFLANHGYLDHPISEEEKAFPIAFSILMHENLEQVERLLRLIYRPQNVYCIHVDRKSSSALRTATLAISRCFKNVFVADKAIDVHWGEFTLLEAELVCARQLLDDYPNWKYYMNLMGREFPLRTNRQLVQIFKAYNGSNDVDGTHHRRPILWTQFVWRNENWRTGQLKPDPPHDFLIAKGSTHVATTRKFIEFALDDQKARDLLEWMKDIRAPDEHFFPTLNHNSLLNIPGAYKGDPDLKWFHVRLKLWQSKTETCQGEWIRYICNLGVGDLPRLVSARQLFLNKIRLEQDPVAFRCLETWYQKRTKGQWKDSFNVSFYASLPFSTNHV